MCGGAGMRMWPLSASGSPRQYLSLADDESLLTFTLHCAAAVDASLEIIPAVLICRKGRDALAGIKADSAGYPPVEIMSEPFGRNTSPVAMRAALSVHGRDQEGVVMPLRGDQYFADPEAFGASIVQGVPVAEQG
tara:strand:+ start:923 stop:1327 length:405 start_codon:yes stop_codon:yes gene_type:complete